MRIIRASVEPGNSFAFRALTVKVELGFAPQLEAPLSMAGFLKAGDGKILAPLTLCGMQGPDKLEIRAKQPGASSSGEWTMTCEFVAMLPPETLSHIEAQRESDKKHDVHLGIQLRVALLTSKTMLSNVRAEHRLPPSAIVQRSNIPADQQPFLLTYLYADHHSASYNNLWLLSGEGSPAFLEVSWPSMEHALTIASSHWMQDYAPVLGIGRFFTYELPLDLGIPSKGDLEKRFGAAREALGDMERDLRAADWVALMEHARPIPELFRDEAILKELLEHDGYTAEATAAFQASLRSLFELTSKFHHSLDKGGKKVAADIRPAREDAEFVYAFSLSVTNLLARKLRRKSI